MVSAVSTEIEEQAVSKQHDSQAAGWFSDTVLESGSRLASRAAHNSGNSRGLIRRITIYIWRGDVSHADGASFRRTELEVTPARRSNDRFARISARFLPVRKVR